MYVGDTRDGTGLHNMLYAALDNAVAEVRCGAASQVAVDLYPDGSCAVADDGQGLPIVASESGNATPLPELLLTKIHFGMRYEVRNNRTVTLENTGLVPVNALSSWLDLRNARDGIEYLIRFESGELVRPLAAVAPFERRLPTPQGTTISFLPNGGIFAPSAFDVETIRRTIGMIAAATGVVVTLTDHRRPGAARSPSA
jgi:DNA gyrase subunit B